MMVIIYIGFLNWMLSKLADPSQFTEFQIWENLPNPHFCLWLLSQGWKYASIINLKSDGKKLLLMDKA